MRRVLLLASLLVFGLTAFAEEDPYGSYRWERMPETLRTNVLEQVAMRRNGVSAEKRREKDRALTARMKKDELGTIGNQHFLILSQEEASELVALVGRQWYGGNDAKYRNLRCEHPWFQPVDVDHPKTQLGQELKATIERKERMARR